MYALTEGVVDQTRVCSNVVTMVLVICSCTSLASSYRVSVSTCVITGRFGLVTIIQGIMACHQLSTAFPTNPYTTISIHFAATGR